jgi:hypothetical protein
LEQRRAPSASPSLPSEALLLLNHSTFKPFERYSDKLIADRQIYARCSEVTIVVDREVVTIPFSQLEFAGKPRAM